jgi:hypothetical protein
MQMRQLMMVLTLAALATGCGARKLPGSDIDDTSETRAIIDLMNSYRHAVEARDSKGLIALIDETFRDDGGSVNPDDDLDYKSLATTLPARLQKLQDIRLDVTVRRIEFDEDETRARVTYSYQLTFRIPEFTTRAQSENDIKQMTLKRVGDKQWKITSGI